MLTLARLQPVDLRTIWLDEARDFTPWLSQEKNLDLLSETLGMDLELEGIEVPVGPYKADIVARDVSSDTKVIIENQLEKTNHDHLGKTIIYAAGLDAKIIIWIAKEFTEEHRRAIDYLNENTATNLRFFGIEMQVFKIGNSSPAPLFKVISSPNDYTSIIQQGISDSSELTDVKLRYLEFWTGFKDYCKEKGSSLNLRKPRPQHWYSIAIGRGKFSLNLTASMTKKRLGCEIYLRGVNAKRAFRLLKQYKPAIEAATGPLEWQELPEGQDSRVILYNSTIDITDKSTWISAYHWLRTEAELFSAAFAPRIKALPLIDAEPSEIDEENIINGERNDEEINEEVDTSLSIS